MSIPKILTIPMFALAAVLTWSGCLTLQAHVPEDVVRQHVAREEGITLPAVCAHDGLRFSEGALVCMEGRRMSCDAAGRWAEQEGC